ncbi:hypothetical protein IFM89_000518 [Coptis chinensis]|uniref:Uncharacterized protein n=1 Tax=Coptis chinensis TaxID=261450 RepID=A0A835H3M5_9MAGN|nr:hypothetical protein IFM89_000518 [Coptis chinensis]
MENENGNELLPEVDSLPDGFVESPTEPTPKTPTFEIENQVPPLSHVEKLRTFPVTLSDSTESVVPEEAVNTSTAILMEKTTPESPDILKTKKLEPSEVKRKNVKRGFKSEKEFLQFTLSYQQVIAERDSAVAVRDKLESLCRELQRQNKLLMSIPKDVCKQLEIVFGRFILGGSVDRAKIHWNGCGGMEKNMINSGTRSSQDECRRVSTEGQDMRLDLATRFHDAIKDVSHKLEEQKDECLAQLKDNDMLRNKLKHLSDQYAVSEQQFTQKLKQKTLELQLADLKVQQHEEKLKQEQSQMKLYAEQVSQLLATEKTLRLQLAADGEKFQQFQEALIKSNDVFETFKQEIEKMAKSTKELKKENAFLKGKCEKSDVTLIELVDEGKNLGNREFDSKSDRSFALCALGELGWRNVPFLACLYGLKGAKGAPNRLLEIFLPREQWKKQLDKMRNQKEKLESLCRSLQAERKQNSLDTNNSSQTLTSITVSSEEVSLETGRCALQSE